MTTVKSMNILIQRNSARISVKVPDQMKSEVNEMAEKLNMSDSQYIKLAISERLEKDKVDNQ